jgi:hypothetical protein
LISGAALNLLGVNRSLRPRMQLITVAAVEMREQRGFQPRGSGAPSKDIDQP